MNSTIKKELLICLFIILSTMAVYWQVSQHTFVFDDDLYVAKNRHIRNGLSLKSIAWAFTTTHSANWHPVTWLSHLTDITLWGLNPGRHHLTNLFFHTMNALLLFYVFRRFTGDIYQSGFVAVFFALHPLHVESVAWVAERKDLLCGFFWLLTTYSYYTYVNNSGIKRYLLIVFFYTLSLLSKPMAVTLPFVLLLMDYWPLNRLFHKKQGKGKIGVDLSCVYEKSPLFLLSLCSCIITYYAQKSGGAVFSLEWMPLHSRFLNALVSYNIYISKLFWPYPLAAFYPHFGNPSTLYLISAVALIVLTFYFVIKLVKQHPYLLVGWLWYLGTLIPVIGIVQVGKQSMADRYSYLPSIGLTIMLGWGVPALLSKWKYKKRGIVIGLVVIFPLLMMLTFKQVQYWKDNVTLFQHAVNVTLDNEFAHYNLGMALSEEERYAEAIYHHKQVLRLKPDNVNALNNLGLDLEKLGRFGQAMRQYKKILQLKPEHTAALINIGNILIKKGQIEKAIMHYQKALEINPNIALAHNNLGTAFMKKNQIAKAIVSFRRALQINPDYSTATNNLKTASKLLRK